jgi:hypothetical protein
MIFSIFPMMSLDGSMPIVVTICVLAGLLYGLVLDKPADILFLIAVVLLAFFGVLTFEQAFSGFSNSAMLTVAALFVVAAGLRDWSDGVRRRSVLGSGSDRGEGAFLHGRGARPIGHGAQQYTQSGDARAGLDHLVPEETNLPLAAPDAALLPVYLGRHLFAHRHEHEPGRARAAHQE